MTAILNQTVSAPLQSGWYDTVSYSLGQYTTGAGVNTIYHLTNYTNTVGGCYISPQATLSIGNQFMNQQGAITFSLVKGGSSSGTLTATPFQDSNTLATAGTATFTLTINDAGSGQRYTSVRSITYGAI